MMYSGDEDCGDEITSGLDHDSRHDSDFGDDDRPRELEDESDTRAAPRDRRRSK